MALLALAIGWASPGGAQGGSDVLNWMSGNRYLELESSHQAVIAASLGAGMQWGLIRARETDRAQQLYDCMHGWTTGQAAAVLRKWLEDNPSMRHYDISLAFDSAVYVQACKIQ
ncbi:MAG: hypothetical protein RLO08_00260 [Parvibaculaceae bacterium]